jgi:hypothetical protein
MASPGQPTESAQTGLTTGETREKTGFLRRRRTYRIDLHAEDFEAFRPRTIHPWIAGRVKDYLRKLRRSSSHDWLSQVPLYIELTAPDGEIISSEVLEPDEPAGRH